MKTRFFIALFTLLTASSALSEPVLVQSGRVVGQGFAFDVDGTCYVLTVNHILKHGGKSVEIITQKGVRYDVRLVAQDDSQDIAVLTHKARRRPEYSYNNLCIKGIMGAETASLTRLSQLITNSTVNKNYLAARKIVGVAGGVEEVYLDLDTLQIEPAIIRVKPQHSNQAFLQSDSGLMVAVGSGGFRYPLGMITRVDLNGVASVVHIDQAIEVLADRISPLANNISIGPDNIRVISIERGVPRRGFLGGGSVTSGMTVLLQIAEQHAFARGLRVKCSGLLHKFQRMHSSRNSCVSGVEVYGSAYPEPVAGQWEKMPVRISNRVGDIQYEFYEQRAIRSMRIEVTGDISRVKGFEVLPAR
ncbi:MAG: S1C family serine protease [Pseudomonadota bacterium]